MAPACSLEQLIYDCRLMNEALADGPEAALLPSLPDNESQFIDLMLGQIDTSRFRAAEYDLG
jgi:hypothetical protein